MRGRFKVACRAVLTAWAMLVGASAVAFAQSDQAPPPAEPVREILYFMQPDGRSFVRISATRTISPQWGVFLPEGRTPDDYLYFFPNDYEVDDTIEGGTLITFDGGDVVTVEGGAFSDAQLTVEADGTYVYSNWDGETRGEDGQLGFFSRPEDFKNLAFGFVLPRGFDFVDYEANVDGEWVVKQDGVAFFASDTNDVAVTVRYRPRAAGVLAAVQSVLAAYPQITVTQDGGVARITVPVDGAFAAGDAALTEEGRAGLAAIAEVLKTDPDYTIAIESHDDATPVNPEQARYYASKLALTAVRAAVVSEALKTQGVDTERMVLTAAGSSRPIADNDTAEGRAQNRRIAILVSR